MPALPAPIVKSKLKPDDQATSDGPTSDQPDQSNHTEPSVLAGATKLATTPLTVEVQALSLGRSFANATLSYAITLTNMSGEAIDDLTIEADVTTAHGNVPVENQVTLRDTPLPPLTKVEQLYAGSAKQARGEFRVPVNELRLIRQGKAHLYIPLLRLKISAKNMDPLVQTYVVGQRQPGISTRLLPFRLDEMAQTYSNIAVRELS